MALGMKMRVAVRSAYLSVFEFAALLPADPASAELLRLCVSLQRCLEWLHPMLCFRLDHGSNVTPSGLPLSLVVRPRGSFVEGT